MTSDLLASSQDASVLTEARRLSALGFNVLPVRQGKKSPAISWKQFQRERTDHMVNDWWSPSSPYVGIFTACGSISQLLVLDCDSPEAERLWRAQIGDAMDATTCVKTSKGHHYWFALAPKHVVKSWAYHEGDISFDVQAEGKGVMTPPSPHPGAGYYSWVREPVRLQPAPALLLGGLASISILLNGGSDIESRPHAKTMEPGTPPTSLLSHLLANPPKGEGGRNEWLIRVVGHYAKAWPLAPDLVRAHACEANKKLTPPLDDTEVIKTADSALSMESAKGISTIENLRDRGMITPEDEPCDRNGWLVGAGNEIMCPAFVKEGTHKVECLLPWSDFNIEVLGVIPAGEGFDYFIRLRTTYGFQECLLPGRILGRQSDLTVWLAERRATIISPDTDLHRRASEAKRLTRYVKSQPAKVYRITHTLGWDESSKAFITHQGVIRAGAAAVSPFEDVRPSLDLMSSGWAPFSYGFKGTREEAQSILREVMTFHDETVCAAYGAWWAASLVRPHFMKRAAQFPFMALEAPSGSGKSTGFFSMMVQLSGNSEGHGQFTAPSLRDRAATHNSGIVWIDDVTDLADVLDLIRQATSSGSRSKKGSDRQAIEKVKLVSPIVISGEGISGLTDEKALGDRAVKLAVPSPDRRLSLHDSTRSQWEDITTLLRQWENDFTQLSGWYVSMALECTDLVEKWSELRPIGAVGRFADTMTTLVIGARILEHLMGDDSGWVTTRLEEWTKVQIAAYNPEANVLTNTILPWALRDSQWQSSPVQAPMVYVEDGVVWFHEGKLSDAWLSRHNLSSRERQLGTPKALRAQRERIIPSQFSKQKWTAGAGSTRLRYYPLPTDISSWVIQQSGFLEDELSL